MQPREEYLRRMGIDRGHAFVDVYVHIAFDSVRSQFPFSGEP